MDVLRLSNAIAPERPPCRLSVVVPCYDEADGLAELHRRLSAVCGAVAGDDYEVVLVDDGSRDATLEVIRDLAQRDSHILGVGLTRNFGHQHALTAGLALCRGERILIIDADLQDPPELLSDMMRLMDAGAEVVYGQRSCRRGERWQKRTTAMLFYRLFNLLTEVKIPPETGDFRLISRRVLDVLLRMPEQHRFVRGMVSWIGFKQVALQYERAERFAGRTKYPWRRMIHFALDALTGFSVRPLRVASYLGLLFAVVASLMIVYALGRWWTATVIPGWTSVMIALLVLGSVQMIVLGVIGEYLGRLVIEVKQRPLFLISSIIQGAEPLPTAEHQAVARPVVPSESDRQRDQLREPGRHHPDQQDDDQVAERQPEQVAGDEER